MARGTMGLSAVVATLLVSGTLLRATGPMEGATQPPSDRLLALTTSQNLGATDGGAIARFLEIARPAAVSAEDKRRVLASLPPKGTVTNLDPIARQKLMALTRLLLAAERASVYEIKVIDVPQAAVGIHGRTVILISEQALALVDTQELQALVAHEVAHEYLWAEREQAFRVADSSRLKDLELMCDGLAIMMLRPLGIDGFRLMTAVGKISRFNRERFGKASNEGDYPSLSERRAFARTVGR
jgi:hypothetical protein